MDLISFLIGVFCGVIFGIGVSAWIMANKHKGGNWPQ